MKCLECGKTAEENSANSVQLCGRNLLALVCSDQQRERASGKKKKKSNFCPDVVVTVPQRIAQSGTFYLTRVYCVANYVLCGGSICCCWCDCTNRLTITYVSRESWWVRGPSKADRVDCVWVRSPIFRLAHLGTVDSCALLGTNEKKSFGNGKSYIVDCICGWLFKVV